MVSPPLTDSAYIGAVTLTAPAGQASAQLPHWLHHAWSITAKSLLMLIASCGQMLTHTPQPLHLSLSI